MSHAFVRDRGLATAVSDIRFDGTSYSQLSDPALSTFDRSDSRVGATTSFNHNLITIPETQDSNTFAKLSKHGVIADVDDLFPVFDAFLRVGKLDRALLVLDRFASARLLTGEEQIFLHNKYLRATLVQMRTKADISQAERLHQWYELQIRDRLPHTAETIACMLKASLLSTRGPRLERLVRRYMSIVPGEAGLHVLSMAEILNDQDLAVITEICPQYNLAAAEDLADELFDDQAAEGLNAAENQARISIDDVPEIAPTPQKGYGLLALNEGLATLSEIQDLDLSKYPAAEREEFQIRLERDTINSAVKRWRLEAEAARKAERNRLRGDRIGILNTSVGSWLEVMEAKLKDELPLIDESEARPVKSEADLVRCMYGPIIQQGTASRIAAVTILTVLNACGSDIGGKGMTAGSLCMKIARNLQEDYRLEYREKAKSARKAEKKKAKVVRLANAADEKLDPEMTPQEYIDAFSNSNRVNRKSDGPEYWSPTLTAHVGAFLLKTLVDTAKVQITREHPTSKEMISQYQPAFTHSMRPRKGNRVMVVAMNSTLIEAMRKEPSGHFLSKHLPMVAKPKPWRALNFGGFFESRVNLVRVRAGDREQNLYARSAIRAGDLKDVFKGLDVLGQTAWRINKRVLQVMAEAWNRGEAIANMPPAIFNPETPPEPDSSSDPMLRRIWMKSVKKLENERQGLHSQRCHMNLQLEIARMFRNQTIYFPHNVDYRGRAYPMPTYLNHMGADHTRGLLTFANGKKLGANGLRWLKIHLANLYGLDKASFEDREAFATENLDHIIESATNPLDGSRWWLKAEDPWQCLATCCELKAAHELPDPTEHISHLPVHQDGTCNGLQHYAALGGDSWGAQQVNLVPGDKPADVYSAVADVVKQGIAEDLKNGNRFAEIMTGKITRKVVKQTVMTNVYGVTFEGGKKQVCKQIDALYPNLEKECGVPHLLLATYVAQHIFKALGSMFRGAHDIQYWLGEIAGRVTRALTPAQLKQLEDQQTFVETGPKRKRNTAAAKSRSAMDKLTEQFRSTVVWTTPLRMPVAQPYRKAGRREVKTCLQTVSINQTSQTDTVNRRKQLQGFPPNFIHSLDASHMLLSALKCDERGLDFAAVHDSFWTHAADIDAMNEVLRDAFVSIHSEDVVGRLAAEFKIRHDGSIYMAKINSRSAAAKAIRARRKELKQTPEEEVMMEAKRLQLLKSTDPDEVREGQEMITPGSIYEKMAAEDKDVQVADIKDVEELQLGKVPEAKSLTDLAKPAQNTSAVEDLEDDVDGLASDAAEEAATPEEKSQLLLEKVGTSHFENEIMGRNRREAVQQQTTIHVWLPLTIPPIPKKVRTSYIKMSLNSWLTETRAISM